MEQFSLDKWLKDKSRKVTTRYGNRKVRIICTDRKAKLPIVALMVDMDGNEYVTYHTKNGWCSEEEKYTDKRDLFFADEKEELNDFESKLYSTFSDIWQDYMLGREIDVVKTVKEYSQELLNLARKEILKEQDRCVIIPEDDYYEQLASQYHKGHEDALKSSPKWKKVDSNPPKVQYNLQGTRLYKDGEYYIELSNLEALPKEE